MNSLDPNQPVQCIACDILIVVDATLYELHYQHPSKKMFVRLCNGFQLGKEYMGIFKINTS